MGTIMINKRCKPTRDFIPGPGEFTSPVHKFKAGKNLEAHSFNSE